MVLLEFQNCFPASYKQVWSVYRAVLHMEEMESIQSQRAHHDKWLQPSTLVLTSWRFAVVPATWNALSSKSQLAPTSLCSSGGCKLDVFNRQSHGHLQWHTALLVVCCDTRHTVQLREKPPVAGISAAPARDVGTKFGPFSEGLSMEALPCSGHDDMFYAHHIQLKR